MTDRMPKQAMEYFADVTGMPVNYTAKNGLHGEAKVRVPMNDSMRLVCPQRIVTSMYRKAVEQAAIVLHVRHDLYLLIGYDCKTHGAVMLALDGTEVNYSIENLFKRAMDLNTVYGRVKDGIVQVWGMQRGGSWVLQNVDSVV